MFPMKLNTFFLMAAGVTLAGSLFTASADTTFARDALKPYVDNGQLPGAISVFSKPGAEEVACVGYADVAAKRAIQMNDPYMQCSQTKGFCGVTIAILVEEGKLTIGTDFDYPPFTMLEDGQPAGFEYAMMQERYEKQERNG